MYGVASRKAREKSCTVTRKKPIPRRAAEASALVSRSPGWDHKQHGVHRARLDQSASKSAKPDYQAGGSAGAVAFPNSRKRNLMPDGAVAITCRSPNGA